MKKNTKALISILMVCSLLLLAACGGGGQSSAPAGGNSQQSGPNSAPSTEPDNGDTLVLKLGHQSTLTSNYQLLSLKFKELVEQKTEGKVKIEIYPMRQLGQDRELLEAMQFGNLDLGVITSAPITNFAPEFSVLDLPYLFDDWDHLFRFIPSDAAKELMKETESKGLITMALMPRGFRHVTHANKAINSAEDLKGMKIRVIESPVYVETFKALGANPQAMSWGDAYTAMQQGAIDGQENTMDIISLEKVDEVQKHVSKTGHIVAFGALMASKALFEKWPEDVQKIILESAAEANIEISKENQSNEETYQKELEGKGMIMNELDRAKLRELVIHVYDPFIQAHGDTYVKAVEALRN